MDETTMPAIEANDHDDERDEYEFAFHLLPTVADGEVSGVVEALKGFITTHQGEVFDEEAPQRFTLAYEIRKAIEGRSHRFTNSWFGWVRFRLSSEHLESVTAEVMHKGEVLRYLIVKLSKEEAENPHRVFARKQESGTVVDEGNLEDASEVSLDDLNKSLEEITS